MRYRYLLVDNDNTLMDFNTAERHALTEALCAFGLDSSQATCDLYHRINKALWEALERGETTQAALKTERFVRLLEHLGRETACAVALSDAFSERLSNHAELMPDAMAFLEAVHPLMRIALVTNGSAVTQRGRLKMCPFTPLLDAVLISEELGIRKPDPRMVEIALRQLGCTDKREAVFLGDSATADIAAAYAAGVDSIHLTVGEKSLQATYAAAGLMDALRLLTSD